MTNNIFKTGAGLLALFGAMTLASCSDKDEMPATGDTNADSDFSLAIKGMPARPEASASDAQDAISVFQFGPDGLFSKSVINSYDPEGINLVKGTTRALYCLSGIDIDVTEETTQAEFALTTITTEEGAASAPLFLSAYTLIEASQMNCELTMKRGVARIDLDARDADMDISSITVDDAPASTYVFEGEGVMPDAGTIVYTYEYAQAPTGVEKGVFMIFESDREVHVTIHGSVDGTEITVPAVIETVERNKVYTLRVYDKNATVKAAFTMTDWEEGDTFNSSPDMSKGLHIDPTLSVFPEDVTVDYVNNIIEVPYSGAAAMKIAFSSEMRVDIDTIIYSGQRVLVDSIEAKHVKFVAEKAYNTDNAVITKFNVDINPQMKARPDYEIQMYVKKTVMNTSYDHITIRVAASPYQIQTVEIGGSTWMAFNATTPDIAEQVFPEIGQTVEEAYQHNWATSIGNFFQYGRQLGYSPWTSNDPNANQSTPRNIPWTDPDCMPVPEGYHVATEAEWLRLIPSGVQIPSTYTAGNGEQIKVEVVELPETLSDSPSASANKAKLFMRYVRFESLETGNVLCIPICGMKTASTAEYPGGGRAMHAWVSYWISADRYTWLFQIGGTSGALTATQGRDRWNYDGFLPVRGVKNS
ncbi:MAG: hypothetical protein K2K26_00780 [Muribaculaceae bacterium]|nr:hypothetical protein [Muribaculaceae bacterium]